MTNTDDRSMLAQAIADMREAKAEAAYWRQQAEESLKLSRDTLALAESEPASRMVGGIIWALAGFLFGLSF